MSGSTLILTSESSNFVIHAILIYIIIPASNFQSYPIFSCPVSNAVMSCIKIHNIMLFFSFSFRPFFEGENDFCQYLQELFPTLKVFVRSLNLIVKV